MNSHIYGSSNFWRLSLLWILALTTHSKYTTFKVFYDTFPLIINIFRAGRDCFVLTQYLCPFSFCGQCCIYLRVIISIIKTDSRLLDGCFGKLKRLSIRVMQSILNSNAEFWPKNWPDKNSFSLRRHHEIFSI